jgi:hypothetical protein
MTRQMWPLNTGDCLIEVASWAGLTVYVTLRTMSVSLNDLITQIPMCHSYWIVRDHSSLLVKYRCYVVNIRIFKIFKDLPIYNWSILKVENTLSNIHRTINLILYFLHDGWMGRLKMDYFTTNNELITRTVKS